MRDCLPYVDILTASTRALADDLKGWSGLDVTVINDGLDLETHYSDERIKTHEPTPRPRFVWYGLAGNRISLYSAFAYLERLHANGYKFELLVIDDDPNKIIDAPYPVIHWRWSLEREIEMVTSADIALLPPYPGPWGRVKSQNKAATAWAMVFAS